MTDNQKLAVVCMIKTIMSYIDIYLTDNDIIDILEEGYTIYKEHLNRTTAAIPLIMACGGRYDIDKEKLELEELELIIKLIKTRAKLREHIVSGAALAQRNEEILKAFGLGG